MVQKKRLRRNRKEVWTMEELLEMIQMWSHAGHPDDFIDEESAVIRLRRNPSRIEVLWAGVDLDDPEYGSMP